MKKGSKHKEEVKEQISESMIGNDNSEKYTEDVVIDLLEKMLIYLTTDKLVEVNQKEELTAIKDGLDDTNQDDLKQVKFTVNRIIKRPHLKLEARLHFKIYNHTWFSDMATKFKDNKSVSYLLKAIDDTVLLNTYESASNGTTNPILAKANLAHFHDWKDKTETTAKEPKQMTDEELDAKLDAYNKRNKK
jgi:hypothetical protein